MLLLCAWLDGLSSFKFQILATILSISFISSFGSTHALFKLTVN
jgi:hypothetical protein